MCKWLVVGGWLVMVVGGWWLALVLCVVGDVRYRVVLMRRCHGWHAAVAWLVCTRAVAWLVCIRAVAWLL